MLSRVFSFKEVRLGSAVGFLFHRLFRPLPLISTSNFIVGLIKIRACGRVRAFLVLADFKVVKKGGQEETTSIAKTNSVVINLGR